MVKHYKSFMLLKHIDPENKVEFAPPEPTTETTTATITPIPRVCRYKTHDPEHVDSVFFIFTDEDIDAA